MTGYAYDLIGMAVDDRHNISLPTSLLPSNNTDVNGEIPHSLCYVDDGIGVAPHIPRGQPRLTFLRPTGVSNL